MTLRILPPLEHQNGHLAIREKCAAEFRSIVNVLTSLEVPLRDAEPFTSNQIPNTPKRQKKKRKNRNCYKLLPVDQPALNEKIHKALKDAGWNTQPLVVRSGMVAEDSNLKLTGDFALNQVFVEVEFGNTASMFRDLFKFQVAHYSGAGRFAILVVASDRFARLFDSGVATYSAAERLLPYLSFGIQMPIWIVGIEPESFEKIERRYNEMHKVCTAHGVDCLTYEEAMKTRIKYDFEE